MLTSPMYPPLRCKRTTIEPALSATVPVVPMNPTCPALVASVAGSAALLAAVVYLPAAHAPFATVSLGGRELLVSAALALVPLAALELAKALRRRR